jgi:predicted amidohydrolase YtcJ
VNWKLVLAVLFTLSVGFLLLFKIGTRLPPAPAHQVFINGEVLTMDGSNRIVEAIAVRHDRIQALGTSKEILALVEDQTTIIDLRGRTLMPGFIDAHGHFPGSALSEVAADLTSPPVGTKNTVADVLAALKVQVDKTAPGEWVQGFGYDDTLLKEMRHLTRADLDRVSIEHPIAAVHVSGHMVVANTLGLERVGINASTADPVGGVIGRRAGSQEPNGLLEEAARLPIMEMIQDLGLLDSYTLMKTAVRQYVQVGVTTAQSGGTSVALAQGLSLFSSLGVIPLRLVVFPFEDQFGDSLLNGDYDPSDYSGERLAMGPVKIVADGSIQGYTGYLSQPYHVPYKGDANYRGYASVPREDLFEKVLALHSAGYQLAIHTNGDQSVEDALDAFEAAQAAHPVDDPRLILIHAQMAREDQIARMKGLGVTPSFFSAHTYYWGDRHRDIFMGPKRAANMSPAKWARDSDVRFTSHLDTPVTPMLPLQAVWSMVYRQTYGGDVLGPQQRISVMDALRAVTIDAAWQVFQEGNRGSLEPGKFADLIILSASPLNNPMGMRELKIEQTLIGGATLYRKQ